jgi:hypothetical protein
MDKVHLILENERLRDMLEYAFVGGVNVQREVYETRPDRPLVVKERRREEVVTKRK